MAKVKIAIPGTVGKSVLIDDSLGPRVKALEAALAALGAKTVNAHNALSGLQAGNDHPQYPLKLGRETIKGQWDFTQQIWAEAGDQVNPGYAFTLGPHTGAFFGPAAGDPYYPQDVLLLHCNGSGGSTVFTDSSSYARAVTATGTTAISTASPKFGTGAGLFPGGTTSWLTTPMVAALNLNAAPFTVEGWFRPSAAAIAFTAGTALLLIGCRDNTNSSGFTITFNGSSNTVSAQMFGGGGVAVTKTQTFVAGTWYHLAYVYDGTTFRLFIDGVAGSTQVIAGPFLAFANSDLRIGADVFTSITGSGWDGQLDDIRITNGTARYASAFTPPIAAFPDSGSPEYLSLTVASVERFRFGSSGQLGIGGAIYGTLRQSFLSGGAGAAPIWSTLAHTDISDWDEAVQDTVGTMLVDSARIDFTYNDGAGTETADIIASSITYGFIQNVSATSRVLGRISSGAGVVEELTGANLLTILGAAGLAGANPSASVGLSAVNGSATSYMRSDGAPALSQAITPTWTGNHTFTPASGNTVFHAGNVRLDLNSQELQLGAGQQLRQYFDGSHSWIRSDAGELRFSLAGATSMRVAAAAIVFNSTTARGSGNCFVSMGDPTGEKGFFGYGLAVDNFYVQNSLNGDLVFATNATEFLRMTGAGVFSLSNMTLAATATAGAATLPANPVGFLTLTINGTSRKIPYYAV